MKVTIRKSSGRVAVFAFFAVAAFGCGKSVQVGQPGGNPGGSQINSASNPPTGSNFSMPVNPVAVCGAGNVIQWTDFQPQGNLGSGPSQQQQSQSQSETQNQQGQQPQAPEQNQSEWQNQQEQPSSNPGQYCHSEPSPSPSPAPTSTVTLTTSFPVPAGDTIDPNTIEVTVDGKPVPSQYDPATQTVTIQPADSGNPGSMVTISACNAGWQQKE